MDSRLICSCSSEVEHRTENPCVGGSIPLASTKGGPLTDKIDFETFPNVVAIVGSRSWTYQDWVNKFVKKLKPNTIVVSGGARGVDTFAREATIRRSDLFYKGFHVE